MEEQLTLDEVNRQSKEQFVARFSGIIEHTEQAAKTVEQLRPFSSLDQLTTSFQKYLDDLSQQDKTTVLQKHPELGAKITMSEHSVNEQKTSGVSSMATSMSHRLSQFNKQYREKFGFPFVICVKERTPESILQSIEDRLNNPRQEEVDTGIDQVKRIAAIRIRQIVKA